MIPGTRPSGESNVEAGVTNLGFLIPPLRVIG
jgi:hypothetical protein